MEIQELINTLLQIAEDVKIIKARTEPEPEQDIIEPEPTPVPEPEPEPVSNVVHNVVRLTDHQTQPPVGFARNDYSRRQAFNCNNTLVLIYAQNGYWHLYRPGGSYIKELSLGGGSVEPQWHPTDPEVLYKFPNNGGLSIISHNVVTGVQRTVQDLSEVRNTWPTAARCWTKSEGSPSKDFKYWGLQVEDADFRPLGLIVVQIGVGIISSFDFAEHNIGRPDHVSISPSGEYIVPSWHVPNECPNVNELGTRDNPCGLMVYSRDFSSGAGIARKGPHSDICIDKNGDDCIVYTDYDTGFVTSFNLRSHEKINLFSLYDNGASTALHISGKGYNHPGEVIISTYGSKNGTRWWTDAVFRCSIEQDPVITKICDTGNNDDGYWSEPHASVNRDFTKVVFNSNKDTGVVNGVDTYIVNI